LADFALAARFGLDFFADALFEEPRFAELLTAGRFADLLARDFDPPRALVPFLVAADFLRDFLARVAMMFLLGVGVNSTIEDSDFETLR
jgi:hypothetical protein